MLPINEIDLMESDMIDALARTYLIALRAEDQVLPPLEPPRRIWRPVKRRPAASPATARDM